MANFGEASSSFSSKPRYTYDVFLSFRGEDTRYTFTGYLYDALCQRGLNIFIDDDGLERGQQISPALLNAIEESRVSIIVFSENYASSPWCLDELVKVLECKKEKGQIVWPIFYKVEPADIRYQKKSYGAAMAKHESRLSNDKVTKWRSALKEVANLSGSEYKAGYKYKFITDFIEEASSKLLHDKHLYIGEHIVGLKSRLEEVKSILDIESYNTIGMVGIHGTGGIGKTILAKVLYNLIIDQFDCACFLEYVRTSSKCSCFSKSVRECSKCSMDFVSLQKKLLSQIFWKENFCLGNVDEGANIIKHKLSNRRVLLVLDDVDKGEQLKKLAGRCDWFGSGSRIIITTRDKHLLIAHGVEKIYEMNKLDDHKAVELFCWKAFKTSKPVESFVDISHKIIKYAMGLPLALNVIGSNLFGRSLKVWESALEKYKRIMDKGIYDILRVSYDSLEDDKKTIFLDIACFFKGERLEDVEKILDACDLSPQYNIEVLVDTSLITVDIFGILWMHDLLQDMGREVVRQEALSKHGERSRLRYHEDVLKVLTENSGTNSVEGIIFDLPQEDEVEWSGAAFRKMNNLRILIVRKARFSTGPKYLPNNLRVLDWEEYPSKSLPLGIYPRKMVVFKLCGSCLKLEKAFQKYENLTHMNFSQSQFITKIPDISGILNIKELNLCYCKNLNEVHDSVGFLTKLVVLNMKQCTNLKIFPHGIQMTCLRFLYLNDCTGLQHFPEILGKMDDLYHIEAYRTGIKLLPHSIGNLTGLRYLLMSSNCNLVSLPKSIKQLDRLKVLDVWNCKKLRQIPGLPSNVRIIDADECRALTLQSTCLLWSQVLRELKYLSVNLPRTVIPNWFDLRCKGDALSFWLRRKIPCFYVAVVVRNSRDEIPSSENHVFLDYYIAGHRMSCSTCIDGIVRYEGNTFLYRPSKGFFVHYFNSLDWNHVEIYCRVGPGETFIIDECGVHVYKKNINMEDIQFDCPIPNPKLQSSKISHTKIRNRKSKWGHGPSRPMTRSVTRCEGMSKEKAERPSTVQKITEKIEQSPRKKPHT